MRTACSGLPRHSAPFWTSRTGQNTPHAPRDPSPLAGSASTDSIGPAAATGANGSSIPAALAGEASVSSADTSTTATPAPSSAALTVGTSAAKAAAAAASVSGLSGSRFSSLTSRTPAASRSAAAPPPDGSEMMSARWGARPAVESSASRAAVTGSPEKTRRTCGRPDASLLPVGMVARAEAAAGGGSAEEPRPGQPFAQSLECWLRLPPQCYPQDRPSSAGQPRTPSLAGGHTAVPCAPRGRRDARPAPLRRRTPTHPPARWDARARRLRPLSRTHVSEGWPRRRPPPLAHLLLPVGSRLGQTGREAPVRARGAARGAARRRPGGEAKGRQAEDFGTGEGRRPGYCRRLEHSRERLEIRGGGADGGCKLRWLEEPWRQCRGQGVSCHFPAVRGLTASVCRTCLSRASAARRAHHAQERGRCGGAPVRSEQQNAQRHHLPPVDGALPAPAELVYHHSQALGVLSGVGLVGERSVQLGARL
eukprot:scaffold472_cov109-Isochrysis_galbana.AAC.11